MRKLKLFFACLLMAVLSIGQVWGARYSLTPNQSSTGSSSTSYITSLTEFTYPTTNGISWKMNQWNPNSLQIKTNQSSAASEFRFYNTSAFAGKITKVVVTFSALTVSDASKLMFLGGTSEQSGTSNGTAGTWNSTAKTLTWTPASNTDYTYFAFYQNGKAASGTNNLASSDAIVVTYLTVVTLNKNDGSANGAVKFDHEATAYAAESFTPATRSNYNCTGYWTASSGGTKILNADGSIAAANITVNTVPYTDANKKWVYTAGTLTLYAQWEVSSCTKKINITKGDPESGGSFNLSETGEQDCCNALTINVTDITAPSGKQFKQITQTGIESGVTIDNNAKTVTYAANSNGASTINVEFETIPTYTVNWYINNDAEPFTHQTGVAGATLNVPNDFSSFTDCQNLTFVGWSESAIGSTPAIVKPTLVEVGTTIPAVNKNYYAVFAAGSAGVTTWTRVTSTSTLTGGGTFIMGYEATANSGVIVPMRNNDVSGASTTADGYVRSGTTAGSSTNGTITMSSLGTNGGDAYEVAIEAGTTSGTIAIKLANNYYVGKPTSGNKVRLFSDKSVLTDMTPELKDDDVIRLKFSADSALSYNAAANRERFARYKSQNDVVLYKKNISADTYHDWVTVCPSCNSVSLSKAGESAGNTFALQRNSADVTSVNTCEAVTVDVVASPATGYELTNIALSDVEGATYSNGVITIPQDAEGTLTVTATFSQKNYSIAVQTYPASIGATLTGATSTAKYGVPQTISTDEPTGYLFGGWYLFDASTFDAENINWNADLSSEIFTGTYVGEDLELEASFPMPDKGLAAVAYFDKIYTPAEALALNDLSDSVFVEGIISQVDEVSTQYKNATYWISADGTTTNQIKIYRGKHLNKGDVTVANAGQITVGNKVIVRGKLSESSNTNQFGQGASYIYTLTEKALSALEIVGNASVTTYDVGDSFNKTGLSLTATYNTGYVQENYTGTTITSNYDAPTTFTAGVTSVTVSAAEGLINTSRDITVTVSSAVLDYVEIAAGAQTEFWAKEQYKEPLLNAYLNDIPATVLSNVTGVSNTTGLDMSIAGNKSVTITYTRKPGQTDDVEYNFTVKPVVVAEADAHSVVTARAIIDKDREDGEDLDLELEGTKTHVKGIVTSVQLNSGLTGGNAQYNGTYNIVIKDETDAAKVMTLYRVSLKSGISSVAENDFIKAYGNLYWYEGGSKYEINTGGQVVWKQQIAVTGVTLADEQDAVTLKEGKTIQLEATVAPANASNKNITWESSDPSVASVDDNGLVTAEAIGTATITVTTEEGGFTATCAVTVIDASTRTTGNAVFQKVTAGPITDGQYLIVCASELVAFDGGLTDLDISSNTISITIDDGLIVAPEDASFTINAAGNIKSYTNKYIGNASNSNALDVSNDPLTNTVSIDASENFVVVSAGGAYLRYNKASGQERFKYFKSGTYTAQQAIQLYKKVEPEEIRGNLNDGKWGTICPAKKVLVPAGASFYKLNYMELNLDGSPYKFFFDEIGENAYLEAGKPYLFIAEGTTITGVKVGDAADDGLHVHNGFVGYLGSGNYDLSSDYDVYTAGANNYYGLQNNIFKLIYGGNSYMVNERAFVQITPTSKPATTEQPAPAYSRRRLVVGAGAPQVTTGTENIEASETPVKVMINGQLFILRGEKMYDATGRLVK